MNSSTPHANAATSQHSTPAEFALTIRRLLILAAIQIASVCQRFHAIALAVWIGQTEESASNAFLPAANSRSGKTGPENANKSADNLTEEQFRATLHLSQGFPMEQNPTISEALAKIAQERGWPAELTRRVAELRVPLSSLHSWSWYGLSPEQTAAQLKWYERMTTGDLRARDATWADNEEFSAMWSDSPEEIAGWEIIVERGPDAFAQFKLQQNVQIPILLIGPEIVACCAFSRRKVLIDGRPFSAQYGQALRVRRAYRRLGYGDQVRRLASPPGVASFTVGQYDIMRSQNFAVVNWWQKYSPQFFDNTPKREGEVPGIPISVAQFPAGSDPQAASDSAIRPVRREDLSQCAALINRTHAGMDLFRPYNAEFLEDILDEGFWGERPKPTGNPAMDWWKSVYGWSDYFVLEEAGRIRACAGLWDRGRDMREQWHRIGGDEHRSIAITCVLDFGFEEGAEECMARLLRWMIGRASELRRDYLAVPIEHLPTLVTAMEKSNPELDTRLLRWGLKDPPISRPYTDLRYW